MIQNHVKLTTHQVVLNLTVTQIAGCSEPDVNQVSIYVRAQHQAHRTVVTRIVTCTYRY